MTERKTAQFFFEVGFAACWAEAFVRNGEVPPFELSDELIERAWSIAREAHDDRAWSIAREAHDDRAEFDRHLTAANGEAA